MADPGWNTLNNAKISTIHTRRNGDRLYQYFQPPSKYIGITSLYSKGQRRGRGVVSYTIKKVLRGGKKEYSGEELQ